MSSLEVVGGHWAAVFESDNDFVELVATDKGLWVCVVASNKEVHSEHISFDVHPEILMLWQGDDHWNKEEVLKFCDGLYGMADEQQEIARQQEEVRTAVNGIVRLVVGVMAAS